MSFMCRRIGPFAVLLSYASVSWGPHELDLHRRGGRDVAAVIVQEVSLCTVAGLAYAMVEAQEGGVNLREKFVPPAGNTLSFYERVIRWILDDSEATPSSDCSSFLDLMRFSPDNARKVMGDLGGQQKQYAGPHARCDAEMRQLFLEQPYKQIQSADQWHPGWTRTLQDANVMLKVQQSPEIPLATLLSADESQRVRHALKTSSALRHKAEEAAEKWLREAPEEALQAWKESCQKARVFRGVGARSGGPKKRASQKTTAPQAAAPSNRGSLSALWTSMPPVRNVLRRAMPSQETIDRCLLWGLPIVIAGIGYHLFSMDDETLTGSEALPL